MSIVMPAGHPHVERLVDFFNATPSIRSSSLAMLDKTSDMAVTVDVVQGTQRGPVDVVFTLFPRDKARSALEKLKKINAFHNTC